MLFTSNPLTSHPPAQAQPLVSPPARWAFIWALRLIMAAVFLGAGCAKLAGWGPMIALFEAIGMGQWFRFAIGSCEILGGVALLVSPLAGAAALALIPVMIGAGMTEIIVLRRVPLAPMASFAALAVIAWTCRDRTRRLWSQFVGPPV